MESYLKINHQGAGALVVDFFIRLIFSDLQAALPLPEARA